MKMPPYLAWPSRLLLVLAAVLARSTSGAETMQPAVDAQAASPKPAVRIVEFVITEHSFFIDFAGPWEVFSEASNPDDTPLFKLLVVSDTTRPIKVGSADLTLVPDYTFDTAPKPDVVVIGGQGRAPTQKEIDWLRRVRSETSALLAVCTGVHYLAHSGLLDGEQATTHHELLSQLKQAYPKIGVVPGKRYVQSDNVIVTAGGGVSGIDTALHVVATLYGREQTQDIADYLEYPSTGWLDGASPYPKTSAP